MDEERLWRRRFLLVALIRVGGILTYLLGIAISITDLARPGGWPAVGFVVAAIGITDAVVVPILLRRKWRQP